MATYIIKRFSKDDPIPYYTFKERALRALKSATGGAIVGSIFGILGGTKGMKIGAAMGAALGAYGSITMTSKKTVDAINRHNASLKAAREKILSNPNKYLEELMGYSNTSKLLKYLESKYDIKLPRDLYRLAQAQDKFIPIAAEWIKKYTLYLPAELYTLDAGIMESEIKASIANNWEEIILLLNTEMADDTWIVWNRLTNEWSYGLGQTFKSLKSILIDQLNNDIDDSYLDPEFVEILIDYREHIKRFM